MSVDMAAGAATGGPAGMQGSVWSLVQRTMAHPRFADLYRFPSFDPGWLRIRCGPAAPCPCALLTRPSSTDCSPAPEPEARWQHVRPAPHVACHQQRASGARLLSQLLYNCSLDVVLL